jgi:hypothetical protein
MASNFYYEDTLSEIKNAKVGSQYHMQITRGSANAG